VIEPSVERAQGDETFVLVHVDVAVACDAKEHGPHRELPGNVGGDVVARALELRLIREENQRNPGAQRDAGRGGVRFAQLERRADRDGAVVEGEIQPVAFREERDD